MLNLQKYCASSIAKPSFNSEWSTLLMKFLKFIRLQKYRKYESQVVLTLLPHEVWFADTLYHLGYTHSIIWIFIIPLFCVAFDSVSC